MPPAPDHPRPSIIATIIHGECQGRSITVDQDELVDLIRRRRQREASGDDAGDPGAFTIGRHPYGDNHLFIGNLDPALSGIHLQVLPVEEDAVRISHCGRAGHVAIALGATQDSLGPGEVKTFPIPIQLTLGNPGSRIAISQADPSPAIEDGPSAWGDLIPARRQADNALITAAAGTGLAELCAVLRDGFAADRVVVASRHEVLAAAGGPCDAGDRQHLWQWYAFNGRAYRLLRSLTTISQADGRSSALGNGIVLRLFQGGVHLFVLRQGSSYTPLDRERLARITWYALGLNQLHGEWFPRMHLEDQEPGHLRRLIDRQFTRFPDLRGKDQAGAMQRIAPRITQETGIIFPRRSRKPLSLNAGLDIPRRHQGLAHGSQSRYYSRLTDMLELFVADQVQGVMPETER